MPHQKDAFTNPAIRSPEHSAMTGAWNRVSAILGGTDSMREAGESYLPRHEHESRLSYSNRLRIAVLYNVTQITLESLVGRPFSDPIHVDENVPEEIKDLFEDIDLQGNDLHTFSRSVFEDGYAKGFSHVMVEFPRVRTGEQPRTLADDREERLRPYWVQILPENLIYAIAQVLDGAETLVHVRINETVKVQVGFTEAVIKQIRVLDLIQEEGMRKPEVRVTLWRLKDEKKSKKEWIVHEQWEMGIDFIPLATFYADRKGFMLAKPPLMDLVDLNIRHWQSSSDQEMIMTVARFPILAASGIPVSPDQGLEDSTDEEAITIGPLNILQAKHPESKFYYVEHKGLAIAAGEKSIQLLEERMSQYGAEFIKEKPGRPIATARALDSAEATSPLQDTTNRFISFINTLLEYTARWMGLESGGTIKISTDFGPEELTSQDIQALIETRKARDISRENYLKELKRRGILEDKFNINENDTALETEIMDGFSQVQLDPAVQTDFSEVPEGDSNE